MKRFSTLILFVALVVALIPAAQAQTQGPAIVRFEMDPAGPFTINEVEAGTVQVTLSWQVLNLGEGQSLALESYRLNSWEALAPGEELPDTGSRPLTITHPLNFGPPTYRLAVRDGADTTLTERYLTVPYSPFAGPAQITAFTADLAGLNETQLQEGTGRIIVGWDVANRPPDSNLVFEQLHSDGTAFSVELPRENAWIPSTGQGQIVPQMPDDGAILRLRLRLVALEDGVTLHERNLVIPLGDVQLDVPIVEIFTANPFEVERGGTVTVNWSVVGAEVVLVGQVDPDGAYIRPPEPMDPSGSLTFTVLDMSYYTAEFFIFAGDEAGNGITQTTAVTVTCPHTYFVQDYAPLEGTCPLTEPLSIAAAHQLYEAGEMIWRSDSQEILVIYSDNTYDRFEDTYEEGETIVYPADMPDEPWDDAIPIRGFGKVWANNPTVRAKLGWALQHEIGYNPTLQQVADGQLGNAFSHEIITLPNGQTIALLTDGTWEVVALE